MTLNHQDDRSVAAGQYVLGTLDAEEKRAFEHAMSQDPSLVSDVQFWTERLMQLSGQLPEVKPSETLWPSIASSIRQASAPVQAPRRKGFDLWKAWAFVSSGLAVALVALLFQTQTTSNQSRYIAVLKSPDNSSEWLVEARQGGDVRLYQLGAMPARNDTSETLESKSLQFWTKPPGAQGPTSLGLVKLGQPLVLPASTLPALMNNQLFEVTLEPAYGSPMNKPTGPILFVGKAVALN